MKKKSLLLVLILMYVLSFSGCTLITFSNESSGEIEYVQKAEVVFDALKEKNTEKVISMFCQKSQDSHDLKSEIEDVYDFLDGNLVSYENISGGSGGETFESGIKVRANSCPEITGVITDTEHEYTIYVQIVSVYSDDSEWEGVTLITIFDENDDTIYKQIGEGFSRSE